MSKIDKKDINEQIAASIKKFSLLAKDEAARQRYIIEMPEYIQKKAKLISAHFLLSDGARMVDMGCETGEITYVLAALNPHAEIIGIDADVSAIEFAKKTYKLPNLTYKISDISIPDMPDDSIDAIVNSNILHCVYSTAGYTPDEVVTLLERQSRKLKPGGAMLVRDYIMPPEGEMVLLELPDVVGRGDDILTMSDANLLVLFSQNARPMQSGCEGFFIEELVPRREGTRLFRLPHKWAQEFIYRKDYRGGWQQELNQEYTFFTWQDYRREFTRLGMRMTYSAPYWNPWVVNHCYKGRFQIYSEDYVPKNTPPTNYFIIAQKLADKQSLVIEERRPSQKPAEDIKINVVRDKKSGKVHELVKLPSEACDIVPYRITPDNRLMVYVRSDYPRPIVNAVMRGAHNLDGKKWSGHLVEPVTMTTSDMTTDAAANQRSIFGFVEKYVGLRPKGDDRWFLGPPYYPSPDQIEEMIETVFIEVENPQKTSWVVEEDKSVQFAERGAVRELDAANIILSAQVGLLPDPRLEMHVIVLMARHDIPLPHWIGETMPKLPGQPIKAKDPDDLLKEVEKTEFEKTKQTPEHFRPVKSVFVEEGKVGRTARGLSAQDIEFVVTDDGIENVAIVLPISRDWDNNLLVAMEPKMMPVPNRMGGDGAMLNAPSFVLPKDVKTIQDAKVFIAKIFRVTTEQVGQLGESYFTHAGVMPQRIYPFFVSSPPREASGQTWQYAPLVKLWRLTLLPMLTRQCRVQIKALAYVTMMSGEKHDMSMGKTLENTKGRSFSLSTDKISIDASSEGYSVVPSRILGQVRKEPAAEQQPVTVKETSRNEGDKSGVKSSGGGGLLSKRYAEALHVKDGSSVQMETTVSVQRIDKDISDLGKQLKQAKLDKPLELTLEPAPPKGRK